jgi:hypothetical protein
LAVLHTVSFYSNRRGGHLCRLFGRLGVTCSRGGKGGQRAVTRALGADGIPGATTAPLRSGSRAKGVAGALGLTLPVGVSSSRLKLTAAAVTHHGGGLQAPRRQGLAGLYPFWWRTRLATRACSSWGCGNHSCQLASELQPKVTTACQIWQHGRQRGVHTRQPPVHRRGRWAKTSAA